MINENYKKKKMWKNNEKKNDKKTNKRRWRRAGMAIELRYIIIKAISGAIIHRNLFIVYV